MSVQGNIVSKSVSISNCVKENVAMVGQIEGSWGGCLGLGEGGGGRALVWYSKRCQ